MGWEHWAVSNRHTRGCGQELFGTPQAVMQDLALFNIFINDLEEGAVSVLIKLAEDIKSGGVSKKKKKRNKQPSHWYRNNGEKK